MNKMQKLTDKMNWNNFNLDELIKFCDYSKFIISSDEYKNIKLKDIEFEAYGDEELTFKINIRRNTNDV